MQGLRTVIYNVPDLADARAWYTEALGQKPYFDEPFYVGFDVGGYELGLVPLEGKAHPGPGGVWAYWGVTDVQATWDALLALGAAPYEAPNEVGSGIIVALVLDPWKNLLGLIYNPHFQVK